MGKVPASLAVRLPPGLDPLLGVFTANLETAFNIVHDTPLRLGETAVVFGQGVVGLLVAQLLRLAGFQPGVPRALATGAFGPPAPPRWRWRPPRREVRAAQPPAPPPPGSAFAALAALVR